MLRIAGKPTYHWMSYFADYLKLSDGEQQIVLQAIMNGPDAFRLLNHKVINPDRLTQQGYSLCFEVACTIAGENKTLASSLENLSDHPEDDSPWAQFIWLERKYLKGLSYWQRGQVAAGWHEWNFIYLQVNLTPQIECLVVNIRIYETIDILNRGLFTRAADRLEKILKEKRSAMDLITLHTLLGPLAICCICTGRLVDAANVHADIAKLLSHFNSEHLNFLAARRKILHNIEKDGFDVAEEIIAEALLMKNISKSRRALVLEQQFELSILKHDLAKAAVLLQAIKQLIAQDPISAGALNIIEEETELLLRQNKPDEALEKIQQILAEAHGRGDVLAEIKGKTFLARTFYLKQNFRSALQILEDVIPIAAEQGYSCEFVDILFHAAGISWHAKNEESLRTYLTHALTLSRKYGIKVRAKCFAYLNALLLSDQKITRALLEVITISENGSEVDYLLDVYGFPHRNEYLLATTDAKRILNEKSIRNYIRNNHGLYWFSREKTLVVSSENAGVKRVEFNKNESFQKILERFINSKDGLTNEDIHSLDSKIQYHSLKHGGKVRATIHRFRKALEPYCINVVHDRHNAKLMLTDTLNQYFVSSAN